MCKFATSNNRLLIHIEEASSFILCLGNRQLTNVARINITFLFDDRKAKSKFPDLVNHQLHTVAAHIGYDLENHHHALADTEVCAEIARIII